MVTTIILSILFALGDIGMLFLSQESFGRLPQGERLERIRKSPNYDISKNQFVNLEPTILMTGEKSAAGSWVDFLFGKDTVQKIPDTALTVIKTDLKVLPQDKDWLVWFGHSSYLINLSGKKFLIDPILYSGSPVSFANKMFKGTDVYKPKDFPDIDYLVISHDHWDHLDYKAVKELEPRVGKVILGLGVGEHFERWGYPKEKLIELDWWDEASLVSGFMVTATPARHFSGRDLRQNRTLWASYVVETPKRTIWIGGDTGYGKHFKQIGEKFKIDLGILENGQYNEQWANIHTLPKYLGTEMTELNAARYMTVHNSRFCLSRHSYFEPLENAKKAAAESGKPLLMPQMGEVLYLE
ncbi:MAG: MBL fold metallo-hydrolase [Fibrobacter sp.]|nr:MBL fold metallo-hydrolase [Fibrobacter sp.]